MIPTSRPPQICLRTWNLRKLLNAVYVSFCLRKIWYLWTSHGVGSPGSRSRVFPTRSLCLGMEMPRSTLPNAIQQVRNHIQTYHQTGRRKPSTSMRKNCEIGRRVRVLFLKGRNVLCEHTYQGIILDALQASICNCGRVSPRNNDNVRGWDVVEPSLLDSLQTW